MQHVGQHGSQGAIAVARKLCVFEEIAGVDFLLERLLRQEVVVLSIHLTRARFARGAGDGEMQVIIGGHDLLDDGRFSRSAGSRNDKSDTNLLRGIRHGQKLLLTLKLIKRLE